MNISNYTRMNYQELSGEIEKTKKKIKTLQEQIRLLEKLQIAERVKNNNGGMNNDRHNQEQ